MTARRALYITGIVALCAWVLVPIYLIALGAFGGRAGVFQWPKTILPTNASLDAMLLFLRIEGVWHAALNSVIAAVLTMVFSIALGAPAGYALARFSFRGANAFRLLVLLTRAFPLAILALPLTVTFIRIGLYDTPVGVSLVHTALALPFAALITASLLPAFRASSKRPPGCSAARAGRHFVRWCCRWRCPASPRPRSLRSLISWNEVFAASVLTVRERTLTAYLLTVLSESPLHYRFAGGFVLIVPSVLFIFAVRKYLFAMWGIASR